MKTLQVSILKRFMAQGEFEELIKKYNEHKQEKHRPIELTDDQRLATRAYLEGRITQQQLAAAYGLSKSSPVSVFKRINTYLTERN